MKLKNIVFTLFLCFLFSVSIFAADISDSASITFENINGTRLLDGSITTKADGENVKIIIESDLTLGGVWLRYSDTPTGGLLNGETKIGENGFWSEYIELDGSSATLSFEKVSLCEINVYSEGELPSEVQRWNVAQNETDIMLFSAHSDDDQLFFAGLVPYYVARGDVEVRVCFFTTSYQDISRVQELLAGLWHCGLKTYPTILPLPDDYSESYDAAKRLLERGGYSYDDVAAIVREVLNTHKPSVAVLHDFEGEYGHGMHRFCARTIAEVIESAADGDFIPSKVYVHLLAQNEIKLPIDEPLERFGGKSAFNVSQESFQFHKSQHWTWFYDWIYGENKQISKASQIRSYNPANYGLYMTLVGEDHGNDMLENIETHAARRLREAAEAAATVMPEQTAAVTEATYINEENVTEPQAAEGLDMKFLIFPAILIGVIIAVIIVLWIVEDRPFVRIYPEDEK